VTAKRPRILIVEDSPTQAEKLKTLLAGHGFDVAVAADGGAGLETARNILPDFVVSDIIMPGVDGYRMCRSIREDALLKETPVILLTSLSDPHDIIGGLECGADDFIAKSGPESAVLESIERFRRNRELRTGNAGRTGIPVVFAGRQYSVAAEPRRILDFLISTYGTALANNEALERTRGTLEVKVGERTASLVREITERKTAETKLQETNGQIAVMTHQLWEAAKLATIGELAASIAHELNNPLQTVSLHLEALSTQLGGDAAKSKALSVMEGELDRMAGLVANLLQVSRRDEHRISTVDVRAEIDDTLGLIGYLFRKNAVAVVKDFDPRAPSVFADREQLRQVFLNLFTNACDAMPSGGKLTLRVRRGTAPDGRQPTLLIEVTDSGTGITPSDMPRVMEIFFTTKPAGKGTGLGLPICRRIVESHGGTIGLASEAGAGTTVRIVLPAAGGETGGTGP